MFIYIFIILGIQELRHLCAQMQQQISQANALLVKNLRHRDKTLSKSQRNCDVITAILQAASLKRRKFFLSNTLKIKILARF
jgi:hypothetical protein